VVGEGFVARWVESPDRQRVDLGREQRKNVIQVLQ
jgi:hypothetical protein